MTFTGAVFAQPDPGEAEEHFKKTNYLMAIPAYKNLLKLERDNAEYNYKLGLCYIRTNIDKTQALQYLERAYKQPKHPSETPYYLAIAHTYNNNFDKALELFKEYRKKAPSKDYAAIDRYIECCISAKEMMKFPINVTFQNLGNGINTEFPDYYPFTTADEKNIYFTSRRKDGKSSKLEFDGYYASEIYSCSYNGETFSAAKNMTTLNSTYDDQVVGLSADGENLFVFSTGTEVKGALYKAVKKSGAFKKEPFIANVNEEKSIETTGFMSPDGSTIFFASNRSGGQGGYDIWMIRKLPNNQWGLPFNLGPEINTAADEDFPTLSVDGTILYFSSNGHVGMGGYDLYQCDWNVEEGTFSAPKNIGYPLNTPLDERTISYAEDGKHAYISASRKGGVGDLDIYRVTFEDVEYIQTLFQVSVPVPGNAGEKLKDALITITNESGDVVGDYRANQNSGVFTIILGPGTFTLTVEADGYKEYTEKIKVNEFTHRMGKIEKIVTLVKE
ncbi:MAG: tetratricopeptide repeat protein [Bacteroidota bacterium]